VLSGLDGRDQILGQADNDTISGGRGPDRLSGGYGEDTIYGGGGEDSINGGPDDDTIVLSDDVTPPTRWSAALAPTPCTFAARTIAAC
jgi:Ca2+-binding RTX toxin-like protein